MNRGIIDFVTILGIFGVPSIFAMTVWCVKACRSFAEQLSILMESQQAQMRASLIKDYKKHIEAGYIDIEDLTEWENAYQKYHLLGANGVLDAKREDLMKLSNVVKK